MRAGERGRKARMAVDHRADAGARLVDGLVEMPFARWRLCLRCPFAKAIDENHIGFRLQRLRGDAGRRDEHPILPAHRDIARAPRA